MALGFEDIPVTYRLRNEAKKVLMHHSYGEFDDFARPTLEELYLLKGLVEGAIYEAQKLKG